MSQERSGDNRTSKFILEFIRACDDSDLANFPGEPYQKTPQRQRDLQARMQQKIKPELPASKARCLVAEEIASELKEDRSFPDDPSEAWLSLHIEILTEWLINLCQCNWPDGRIQTPRANALFRCLHEMDAAMLCALHDGLDEGIPLPTIIEHIASEIQAEYNKRGYAPEELHVYHLKNHGFSLCVLGERLDARNPGMKVTP